jgi:hypothetical protein
MEWNGIAEWVLRFCVRLGQAHRGLVVVDDACKIVAV